MKILVLDDGTTFDVDLPLGMAPEEIEGRLKRGLGASEAIHIVLRQGQRVCIEFHETDGEIVVDYDSAGDSKLSVVAELPDSEGRSGLLYCEDFSMTPAEDWCAEEERKARKLDLG